MDFTIFIPITLFVMIVAIIKIVTDYRLRNKLLETQASEELARSLLTTERLFHLKSDSRHTALKWGLVLTLMGAAFGLMTHWQLGPNEPATFGLLFAAAGIGLLLYYLVTLRMRREDK